MKKYLLLLLFIPFISISQNEDILLNGTVSTENNQIKNVADPTDAQDAMTKNYVDTQFYSQSQVDSIITTFQNQINDLTSNVFDLNFSTAFTFESDIIYNYGATGMIGSSADNSLFIATRENSEERILKINLETNSITEKTIDIEDFVTKRLHIEGNLLFVFGGRNVNTYNLDLIGGDPTSVLHGKELTRFGMSELNGNAYLIGGDLSADQVGEKIFTWNIETETLSEFWSLPEKKYSVGTTIVDDNLYVFGGTSAFATPAGLNATTAYKININNPSNIEINQLNQVIDVAFARKFQNLIYVAGQIISEDANGDNTTNNPTIGVYNTLENTYKELNTNLTNPTGTYTIHQMCILNEKMYIIYAQDAGSILQWEILVSDLN
jgi:hypothetical protein